MSGLLKDRTHAPQQKQSAFDKAGANRIGNIGEHKRDPPLPRVGESERRRRMGLQLHRVDG
jgi:hypothetical protein